MPPDNATDRLKRLVKHPVTLVTGALGVLSSLFQLGPLDAIMLTLWTNAGSLFTALSVIRSQLNGPIRFELLGNVLVISQSAVSAATIAVGGVFVLSLLDKVYDNLMRRLRRDD